MFEASRSLIAGAKIIIASEGIRDRGATKVPTLPVTVCCALAVEIGIKALLTIEGKPYPPMGGGHSLKALFEALSDSTQQDLLLFQVQFTGFNPSDAKAILDDEDMAFVKWRYAYEHAYLSTNSAFLHDFGVAVSEMLRSYLENPIHVSDEVPHSA